MTLALRTQQLGETVRSNRLIKIYNRGIYNRFNDRRYYPNFATTCGVRILRFILGTSLQGSLVVYISQGESQPPNKGMERLRTPSSARSVDVCYKSSNCERKMCIFRLSITLGESSIRDESPRRPCICGLGLRTRVFYRLPVKFLPG